MVGNARLSKKRRFVSVGKIIKGIYVNLTGYDYKKESAAMWSDYNDKSDERDYCVY